MATSPNPDVINLYPTGDSDTFDVLRHQEDLETHLNPPKSTPRLVERARAIEPDTGGTSLLSLRKKEEALVPTGKLLEDPKINALVDQGFNAFDSEEPETGLVKTEVADPFAEFNSEVIPEPHFDVPRNLLTYVESQILNGRKKLGTLKWELGFVTNKKQLLGILERHSRLTLDRGGLTDEEYEKILTFIPKDEPQDEERIVSIEKVEPKALTPGDENQALERVLTPDTAEISPVASETALQRVGTDTNMDLALNNNGGGAIPPLPPERALVSSMSPEELEKDLQDSRREYVAQATAWKQKIRSQKSTITKIFNDLGVERKAPASQEPQELVEARAVYIIAKQNKWKGLFGGDVDAKEKNIETLLATKLDEREVLDKEMLGASKNVEKNILQKTLAKAKEGWSKLTPEQRRGAIITLVTATGIAGGVVLGGLTLGGAAAVASVRAVGSMLKVPVSVGGAVAMGVNKATGAFFKRKNRLAGEKIDETFAEDITKDSFYDKEGEAMESTDDLKRSIKRQGLYKAGATLAAGVAAGFGSHAVENHMHDIATGGPEVGHAPGFDIEKPDIKLHIPTENIHTPIEVHVSSRGFIQTMSEVKAKMIHDYGGVDKIPPEFNKSPVQLAKDFNFYDAEGQSAIGMKGEMLHVDSHGNLVYEHLNHQKEVLFNAETGEIHKINLRMQPMTPQEVHQVSVGGEPSLEGSDVLPDQSVGAEHVPDSTGAPLEGSDVLPDTTTGEIGGEMHPTLNDGGDVPSGAGLSPDTIKQIPYGSSFVDVIEKGGSKSMMFNGTEIAHEHVFNGNKLLVLDDKFQVGSQNAGVRSAFAEAFKKSVLDTQIGKTPIAIPFEGGEVYLVHGLGNNPNALHVLLNGKEIAQGVIGGKVELLNTPGIRSGWLFGDTIYEKAFKAVKGAIKSMPNFV